MVDRHPTGTPSHDGERHGCPREMDRPAVRHGKLDDASHEQETKRGKARPEAEYEEHRKDDLSTAGEEGHDGRSWKVVRAAGEMELELVGKKVDRRIVQLKEPTPFQDA